MKKYKSKVTLGMDRPSIICPFVISDTLLITLPLPQYTPASLASLLFLRYDKYSSLRFTSPSLSLDSFLSNLQGFLPHCLQVYSDVTSSENTSMIILHENLPCLFKITYSHQHMTPEVNQFFCKSQLENILGFGDQSSHVCHNYLILLL